METMEESGHDDNERKRWRDFETQKMIKLVE